MVSSDDAAPYDRPNCSKDYLAGNAPEEWMPLRPDDWYKEHAIDLMLRTEVAGIDAKARQVTLAGGRSVPFDKLLLATGAEPIRLDIPGADQPHVRLLRSLADSRAIIDRAKQARRAVVIGASFIGLEVAAALRAREIETHVVAPERRPLERVLGPEFGDFVRALHEEHGVVFHLEDTATAIGDKQVTLKGGGKLDADLVVVGVGVRPRTQLAERAGLKVDRGVMVERVPRDQRAGHLRGRRHRAAGPTAIRAKRCASSTGSWPSARARPPRATCWAGAKRSPRCRSSGASTTTCRSTMSATPRNGTASRSTATSRDATAWCATSPTDKVLAVASIYRDVDNLKAEVAMESA